MKDTTVEEIEKISVEKLVQPKIWQKYTGQEPGDTIFYIIIPAHNEESVIYKTLDNLSQQIIPIGSKMIINVIPNGCTDNTKAEVIRFKHYLIHKHTNSVKIILSPIKQAGKPRALNYGRKLSPTDLIFCTDADTLPTNNSVSKLYALIQMSPQCTAASIMPRRISNHQDGHLQHMQDYYDAVIRDNGAIVGKFMIFKNKMFANFPINCMSDDTWLEFTSINLYGPKSTLFLGQYPNSNISAYYHAPTNFYEFISQHLRWKLSFQHLIKTEPQLQSACKVAYRIKIPSKFKELLSYLKNNYIDIPLIDKLIMNYIWVWTRKISEINGLSEKFSGKTHWNSPKSDRK